MNPIDVKIKFVGTHTQLPEYKTAGAAAVDLIADTRDGTVIYAGETVIINTGIAVEVPPGYAAKVMPRSGQALRALQVANSPGLIDEDYRGELGVILYNASDAAISLKQYERIAQLMFVPYVKAAFQVVTELSDTSRGTGGFGHTGSK